MQHSKSNPLQLKLRYVRAVKENLPEVLRIQHLVWPLNPTDQDYRDKVKDPDDTANVNWLVYAGADLVGISGVFTFDPDEVGYDDGKTIWMDWFAVLPSYRSLGYGRQILLDTIKYARSLGQFKFFRLDTSDYEGRVSTKLYDQVMQLREDYTAETIPKGHRGLVYSYSLDGSEIIPWNNQLLELNYNGASEVEII